MMESKFESLIEGLLEQHYGLVEAFIPAELCQQLSLRLQSQRAAHRFHDAGIGKLAGQSIDRSVRGDQICWLDKVSEDPTEIAFLGIIDDFIRYLNRTCYTGIISSEFHFAIYPVGSFYRRHLDQFKSDDARRYSMVFYLNEDWEASHGGELALFLNEQVITIAPSMNKMLCFASSQLEHEVRVAHRERLSITGWLKV